MTASKSDVSYKYISIVENESYIQAQILNRQLVNADNIIETLDEINQVLKKYNKHLMIDFSKVRSASNICVARFSNLNQKIMKLKLKLFIVGLNADLLKSFGVSDLANNIRIKSI